MDRPEMDRPVMGFLTDFGLDGAAAICRGVMLSIARDAQIIDISHTVRKYSILDGAYLLASAVPWLPIGVHVGVVDPGVGTERRPIGILTARGDVLIGPDNGLLVPAAERLGGIVESRLLANRDWLLPATSKTFHGRDIFAPVAAHLAIGGRFADAGTPIEPSDLIRPPDLAAKVEEGRLVTTVTYVDSFGNARLAGGPAELSQALGALEFGDRLEIDVLDDSAPRHDHGRWLRTFGEGPAGETLVYEDSSGNLAIGVTNGDAAGRLRIATGARIGLTRG
jgi:S-adenosylmethionine hydrolase